MQLKQPQKSKKKIIIISIIAILVIASIAVLAYVFSPLTGKHPESTQLTDSTAQPNSSTSSSNDSDQVTDDEISDDAVVEKEKDHSVQYEGQNPNKSSNLTGVINYLSVQDDNLVVRLTIEQSLGTGSCSLSLTNGSSTVTRTANIIQNPSSSACDGFSVPVSELSSGKWQIKIVAESGNRSGTFTSEVTI